MALRLTEDLPIEYQQDYKRWQGEPVKAIIIPQSLFRLNASGHPTLLKHHQQFILSLAHLNPFVIIEVILNRLFINLLQLLQDDF